jgi:hypothetical protein
MLRFSAPRGAGAVSLSSFIRGPQGAAATITVGTVAASNAGSTPTVINIGTTEESTFNFTIPRGADSGMRYAFESSTTMAAPASGGFRLNNATLASVTALAVNATNADGIDVSDFIATWDDSTNSTKGTLVVRKEGSGTVLGVFTLGAVTDNGTWLQVALTYVSGSGSFSAADKAYLTANLTGNKGTDGQIAGPGVSVDNEVALFNGTSGTTLKRATGSGLAKLTSGVLSVAAAGTDYAAATSGSVPLKGNGSGGFSAAVAADIETLFALGNWKVDYLNGSNVRTAVALGADKTLFASNGATSAPSMRTAANLGILEFGVTATVTGGFSGHAQQSRHHHNRHRHARGGEWELSVLHEQRRAHASCAMLLTARSTFLLRTGRQPVPSPSPALQSARQPAAP